MFINFYSLNTIINIIIQVEKEFSDDLRRNVKGRHYLPIEQQLVTKNGRWWLFKTKNSFLKK